MSILRKFECSPDTCWAERAVRYLDLVFLDDRSAARSKPGGAATLYGTCYAQLGLKYLNAGRAVPEEFKEFVRDAQDAETGLIFGPELEQFAPAPCVLHSREHLLLHSTCTALPVCSDFGIRLRHPIRYAHRFCEPSYLKRWLDERNWKNAWFEGNNILFVGQLLVYLRDVEMYPQAAPALQIWFDWLDREVDPATGLWGTNGHCSAMEAVYGGYHQLLLYYHENHPLPNLEGLVDTVLSLQHHDGGFNPRGNAGACEDVDSVDILVNCYKRCDYRRAEIRYALRRCLRHILATQNVDGGFPYNRNRPQSHMGIPGTEAEPNVSCTFPTWFRIHTLALIAEIIPRERAFNNLQFDFSESLSMGWHRSPDGWSLRTPYLQLAKEVWLPFPLFIWTSCRHSRRLLGRVAKRLGVK